jgi:hypothetical protein
VFQCLPSVQCISAAALSALAGCGSRLPIWSLPRLRPYHSPMLPFRAYYLRAGAVQNQPGSDWPGQTARTRLGR